MDAKLIELLQTLVRIPSVNPSLANDASIAGEHRLAEFLAKHLAQLGYTIEWHEPTKGRPNVVGRFGPRQARRTLLLESHLDTQGVHHMTVAPFAAEHRDGRIYGRGACDTKGPMAAALHALDASLLHRLAESGIQVVFVGAMGEEKGNLGAEQLVDLGVGADEAVVLEPTDLNIVHAHKGTLWFEVEVRGLAAHGSNPQHGLNAIQGMAAVLDLLHAQLEQARAEHQHAVLGAPTLNVGVIRGGTSINIVPDRCVIEVDRRTVPGEDHREILRALQAALHDLKKQGVCSGFDVRPIKDGVPFETASDSALVRRLGAAARDAGVSARTEGAGWYSDAGPFSRTCREVAVFGPGSILQAHTADEFIEVSSLQAGCRILRGYFERAIAEAGGRTG